MLAQVCNELLLIIRKRQPRAKLMLTMKIYDDAVINVEGVKGSPVLSDEEFSIMWECLSASVS